MGSYPPHNESEITRMRLNNLYLTRLSGNSDVQLGLRTTDQRQDFPSSSAGKESTCNAEDPSLIPGLGRSSGEERGSSRQYSWASLVVQTVKKLPAMQETWVRSLGGEDPLEEGMATHSVFLPRESPWTKAPGGLHAKS